MSATHTPRTYNLATVKGREAAYAALLPDPEIGGPPVIGDLSTYITTGIPELVYQNKNNIVVTHEDYPYIIKSGVIYELKIYCLETELRELGMNSRERLFNPLKERYFLPEGIVLPTPLQTNRGGAVVTILQNGDDGANRLVGALTDYNFPTVSFRCVGRFYDEKNVEKGVEIAIKALLSGQLQVIDFTEDEERPMTVEEQKSLLSFQQYERDFARGVKPKKVVHPPEPPERGFSVVGDHTWHRPATVLLYDKSRRMTLLLGTDENSYFGCELPGFPKTVADGLTALIPKDLRDRTFLERQGEWFFVPVDESEVPSITETAIFLKEFSLPVEHEDSNHHVVECHQGRVSKNGTIYAFNPAMEHDDHERVKVSGWYTFRRNTAKRSYSEDGVD